MAFDILRPFGPSIYHSTMSDEMLNTCKKIAEDSRSDGADMRQRLAGNIARERRWVVDDEVQHTFYYQLKEHLHNFSEAENKRFQNQLINPGVMPDLDKMEYQFITDPWINYQLANEFNPIHSHHGQYSAVLYINVPEVIAEENIHSQSNMACSGQIEFVGDASDRVGANGTHKIIPKTGDILLFDAKLKHCVYPFKSEVERISMSFNIAVNFQ
tara:strand:+ start:536 stop:1177 length:642 start_codon:yes stop_codon:yes gene_type:complete